MAHKTLIGGAAYEVSGGKTLVGGTAYSIDKGKTLVGGTGYEITFNNDVVINLSRSSTYSGNCAGIIVNNVAYLGSSTTQTITIPWNSVIRLCIRVQAYNDFDYDTSGAFIQVDGRKMSYELPTTSEPSVVETAYMSDGTAFYYNAWETYVVNNNINVVLNSYSGFQFGGPGQVYRGCITVTSS